MLLQAALAAMSQVLSRPFRAVLWKSLALTLALLALIWAALTRLFSAWLGNGHLIEAYPWLDAYAVVLAGFGLVIGLAYLIPSVSMLVAGFFLDDVALTVERQSYPADPPGRAMPVGRALAQAGRFALVAFGVNLAALLFVLIPGVNLAAFFLANSYLLGREYFSLAAGRFGSPKQVKALQERYSGTILLGGFLIAALVAIPIANLLTPLFGTVLMVHLHKRLIGASGSAILPPPRR